MTNRSEEFNPLEITENVHKDYINFFLSSFSPENVEFQNKLKIMSEEYEYLYKGPYMSIPPKLKLGGSFRDFEKDRISAEVKRAFSYISRLYVHQEKAISHILDGHHTIVSVPTGGGKTETFLIPIIQYCYEHRGVKGVKAVLIYPMNALAKDQVERLRKILWKLNQNLPENEKITFAIYTGETPENKQKLKEDFVENEITESCPLSDEDLEKYGCPKDCDRKSLKYDVEKSILYCPKNRKVKIDYQILTREDIRKRLPDILITNYVQLEHILSRKEDKDWVEKGTIKYLVMDELHSYIGAKGVDVAFLIRRFKNRVRDKIICIATSATLSKTDELEGKKSIAEFASKIFGEDISISDIIEAELEKPEFPEPVKLEPLIKSQIKELDVDKIDNLDKISKDEVLDILSKINPTYAKLLSLMNEPPSVLIGKALMQNPIFQQIIKSLEAPKSLNELVNELKNNYEIRKLISDLNDNDIKLLIWKYLKLGSKCKNPNNFEEPLINITVHNFFRTIGRIYECNKCGKIYPIPKEKCEKDDYSVDEIGVCRFCGHKFHIVYVDKTDFNKWFEVQKNRKMLSGKLRSKYKLIFSDSLIPLKKLDYRKEFDINSVPIWISYEEPSEDVEYFEIKRCIKCGAILDITCKKCTLCGSNELKESYAFINIKNSSKNLEFIKDTRPRICPYCGNSYGRYSALSPVVMSSDTSSVVVFDRIYSELPKRYKKLLIFTDNRQIASYLAKHLEETHLSHTLRVLIYKIVQKHREIYYPKLEREAYEEVRNWANIKESGDYSFFETKLLEEICSLTGRQRSLENLGLIEINYAILHDEEKFKEKWLEYSKNKDLPKKDNITLWRKFLITLADYIREKGAVEGLHNNPHGRNCVVGFSLNEKYDTKSIQIKDFISKGRTKQRLLAKKVFKISDSEITKILENAFKFLIHIKVLKEEQLKKYNKSKRGYIIDRSAIIIRIPEKIFQCSKCKKIYVNNPPGVCPTYRCDGTPEEKDYKTFERENTNYYFNLYRSETPVKMVTAEDTGALKTSERHEIELEFKKENIDDRKYDVIVATPTLELGIDIGDLVSVGLYKAPPSPANYIQRVGRAGRREKISLNNTFLYLSPIDRYYYEHPEELIRGEFKAPNIDIENRHLLQRHVNATILSYILTNSNITYPIRSIEFIEKGFDDKFLKDIDKYYDYLVPIIQETFRLSSLETSEIESMIHKFKEDFKNAVEYFKREVDYYRNYESQLCHQRRYEEANRVKKILERLENSSIVSYLMEVSVLPRYAFPGIYVEIRDIQGKEEFEGRARSIAITEYAPLMRSFMKKRIYKSIAIDMKILQPKKKIFYICPNCGKYIFDTETTNKCPICKRNIKLDDLEGIEAIEPNIIYIKREWDVPYELREYQEAKSSIYFKTDHHKEIKNQYSAIEPNIELINYGHIDIVKLVDKVVINNREIDIEICENCGKAKESLSERTYHIDPESRKRCYGKFKKLALYHIMPTNVISIKFKSNKIFGIEFEEKDLEEVLITFKNAIINTAQRMLYAQDGEIDGEVKIKDREIIIYDNIEGGAGYALQIFEMFDEILKEASDMILSCGCEFGCPNCLWSYRRKRDIPKINKSLVLECFKNIRARYLINEFKKNELSKYFDCKNVKCIISKAYSFDGVLDIKNFIKNANNEIYVLSLYVTDDEIAWPDEHNKSWVDILSGVHLSKDVNINVILRKPTTKRHRQAIDKMRKNGINIYIYEKEPKSHPKLPGIIHAKIIIIDPYSENRRIIFTSANLSPEVYKNADYYLISNDEKCILKALEYVKEFIKESKKLEN